MMSSSLYRVDNNFKNINFPPNCTKLDVLAAVCGSLLEEEKKNNNKKMIKKQRKNTCWGSKILNNIYGHAHGFSSGPSKDSCFPLIKPLSNNDDLHTLLLQQGLSKKTKPCRKRSHNLRSQEESDGDGDAEIIHEKKKMKIIVKPPIPIRGGKSKSKTNTSFAIQEEQEQERRPHLPMEFKECIACLNKGLTIHTEILVIQKELYGSDIIKQQNRFSIPFGSIINKNFLDDDEIKYLEKRDDKGILNRMEVNLIDPSRIKWTVNLARWVMPKDSSKCDAAASKSYVLNGSTWAQIVAANELEIGDEMQLWAVRVERLLWFALVRLPKKIVISTTSINGVEASSDTRSELSHDQ